MTTTAICLRGRRNEFGPSLDLPAARDVTYVGRACYQGGWRLPGSPFANPFRAQRVGGATKAVELYVTHLSEHPELVLRARRELTGRRLACWCDTTDPKSCHAAMLAVVCDLSPQSLAFVLGGAIGAAL